MSSLDDFLITGYSRLLLSRSDDLPSDIIKLILNFFEITAIINIAVGKCGNSLTKQFYKSLMNEYNLNDDGLWTENSNKCISTSYLRQSLDSKTKRFVPRSILTDLKYKTQEIFSKNSVFITENFIFPQDDHENSIAKTFPCGYYTQGNERINDIMNILRKEIETYDEPQCIQYIHSIAGGVGSGLSTLIMKTVKETFPNLINISFCIHPLSEKILKCYDYDTEIGTNQPIAIGAINSLLGMNYINEFCDGIFLLDNQTLYNLAINKYKMLGKNEVNTFTEMNFIANQMINDVSSIFRYNDSMGFNVSYFMKSMIKYPKFKYFLMSKFPFYDQNGNICKGDQEKYENVKMNVNEMTKRLFSKNSNSIGYKMNNSMNISTLLIYRGYDKKTVNNKDIMKYLTDTKYKFEDDVITTFITKQPLYLAKSTAMISNSTLAKSVLQKTLNEWSKVYKYKSFFHWFKNEGLEESEMVECDMNLRRLVTEYSQYEENKKT
eukprot:521714_1